MHKLVIATINRHTIFEVSGINFSKDKTGYPKLNMVKVIWHKTPSPPQTDSSIIFVRCRQCVLPRGHIGTAWQIQVNGLNLCFLWPMHPIPQPKQQIDWFNRFCTAHDKKSLYFTMCDPFPKNCPFSRGSRSLTNSWFLGWVRAHNPNGTTIASAVFAGLTSVPDRHSPTDRPRYLVSNNRLHLRT